MRFFCECCKYQTNHKGSYDKHLLTYKHHKNKKSDPYRDQGNPYRDQGNLYREQKSYKCKHCNTVLSTKSNYNRHLNVCKKKIILDNHIYQKKYKKSQQQLHQMKEMLYEKDLIISDVQRKNRELLRENELLREVKDICKKSNKSVMNIIINNYGDAPNLEAPPIEDMSAKDFKKYINSNFKIRRARRIIG